MASPTLRASSTAGNASAANVTINKPTGTADGDILVAVISKDDTGAVTAPSGWTLLSEGTANTFYLGIWWKRAASEGSSWTWSFSSVWRDGIVLAYQGAVGSGDPIDPDPPSTMAESASASTLNASSNTTATADTVMVCAANDKSSSAWVGVGSGLTARVQFDEVQVADGAFVGPGATGTKASSNNTAGAMKAYLLEIASVAAGGGGGGGGLPFFMQEQNLMVGGVTAKSGNLQ